MMRAARALRRAFALEGIAESMSEDTVFEVGGYYESITEMHQIKKTENGVGITHTIPKGTVWYLARRHIKFEPFTRIHPTLHVEHRPYFRFVTRSLEDPNELLYEDFDAKRMHVLQSAFKDAHPLAQLAYVEKDVPI